MKIKKLIKILNKLNPEHKVILSKDSEGNTFSLLSDYMLGEYVPESTWEGHIISKEDAEEEKQTYNENCIVLWPTN